MRDVYLSLQLGTIPSFLLRGKSVLAVSLREGAISLFMKQSINLKMFLHD